MGKLTSVVGLIGAFAVAHGCDRWVSHLQVVAPASFSPGRYVWLESVAVIIVAIALMLLAWHVVFRADRCTWIAVVFIVVGIGLTFAMAMEVSLQTGFLGGSRIWELSVPGSYGHCVAAFVAVIGIASLVLPRRSGRTTASRAVSGRAATTT